MIQAIPLSEATELLLQRADELKQKNPDKPDPVRQYRKGKCRSCRAESDQLTNQLGLCPPCRRERWLQQLRTNNERRRGPKKTIEGKASSTAIIAKPCCSQCGAEGPVSRNLQLCHECKYRRMERKVKARRVVRFADWRSPAPLSSLDSLPEPDQVLCPHCGRPMMPGAIGCWRHSTLLLMKQIQATAELYR